jgi:hypothetical protein
MISRLDVSYLPSLEGKAMHFLRLVSVVALAGSLLGCGQGPQGPQGPMGYVGPPGVPAQKYILGETVRH